MGLILEGMFLVSPALGLALTDCDSGAFWSKAFLVKELGTEIFPDPGPAFDGARAGMVGNAPPAVAFGV